MSRRSFTSYRFAAAALLCSILPLLTGCGSGILSVQEPGESPAVKSGSLTGKLHGGQNAVVGASIDLYTAGTSGYGSAGSHIATTTTDSNGNFTLTQAQTYTGPLSSTYACPSSSSQIYIVASGGSPQLSSDPTGTNSALSMAVAIGTCGTIGAFTVDVNEVTATATMAALQQYFNPVTQTFGYPNNTQASTAFGNNVSLIPIMVNFAAGTANTSVPQTNNTPLGAGSLTPNPITVTATPEYQKLNLIANIIAACVNSTSSATNVSPYCTTLFANAAKQNPAITSQPTLNYSTITPANETTLQALYFMFTNPTSGGASSTNATASGTPIKNLFDLASAFAPFSPAYPTAPTDWTVAVNYASASTCVTQVGTTFPTGTTTITSSAGTFFEGFENPAIDASGNLWGTNYTGSNLIQLSPTGFPLTCALGTAIYKPQSLAIDPAGYIWVNSDAVVTANETYYLFKWNPKGTTTIGTATTVTGSLDSSWPVGTITTSATFPYTTYLGGNGLTIDGNGNVFSASTYEVFSAAKTDIQYSKVSEYAGAGVAGATPPATNTSSATVLVTGLAGTGPQELQVDHSGNLWAVQYETGATDQEIDYIYPDSGSSSGYSSINIANTDTLTPRGLAIGQTSTGIETVNMSGKTWQIFTPPTTAGGAPTVSYQSASGTDIAGLVTPSDQHGTAVDGASNVWSNCAGQSENYVTGTTNTPSYFALCEITSGGINISATYAGKAYGGFQKFSIAAVAPVLPTGILPSEPSGIVVDPSGNVWTGQHTGTIPQIMELVGQAVPVVTPLSVAVGNNTLGVKP
jgi:hypothetical protein